METKDLIKQQDEFSDIFYGQRKDMLNRSLSTILRATLVVKNFGDLKSVSGPESLYDPAYTGHHIVLLECQLKTPS